MARFTSPLGWTWDQNDNRSAVKGLINPFWIAVNMLLRAMGLYGDPSTGSNPAGGTGPKARATAKPTVTTRCLRSRFSERDGPRFDLQRTARQTRICPPSTMYIWPVM